MQNYSVLTVKQIAHTQDTQAILCWHVFNHTSILKQPRGSDSNCVKKKLRHSHVSPFTLNYPLQCYCWKESIGEGEAVLVGYARPLLDELIDAIIAVSVSWLT